MIYFLVPSHGHRIPKPWAQNSQAKGNDCPKGGHLGYLVKRFFSSV